MNRTLRRAWIPVALGTFAVLASGRLVQLELRLDQLEERPEADPHVLQILRGELDHLQRDLDLSRQAVSELREAASLAQTLDGQVESLRGEMQNAALSLEEQDCRLELWESRGAALGSQVLDQRIRALREMIEDDWGDVRTLAASAAGLAESTKRELATLETTIARDADHMWHTLVGPVVQLAGETTVGSGVLLRSHVNPENEDAFVTWLITSWHVVRDIQADARSVDAPVPVAIYSQDARIRNETATLVAFDGALDAALLRIDTETPLEYGATLMPRSELAEVSIFQPVYAVGCPLGNDPIPTYGEVAATRHVVDGERYWMISAPTYVGNSGGGIFDARGHRLVGIFSKIYTHGTLRPTVVPHMGLVTPLDEIYDWLASVGHGDLEPHSSLGQIETAAAQR